MILNRGLRSRYHYRTAPTPGAGGWGEESGLKEMRLRVVVHGQQGWQRGHLGTKGGKR